MKLKAIQLTLSGAAAAVGYILGGFDGLMQTLIMFMIIDYATGVLCAINDRTLSSSVGFRGICRKLMIFMIVAVANLIDVNVIGSGSGLRTAAVVFYLTNEGISILENAARIGLPVPEGIIRVLAQLKEENK